MNIMVPAQVRRYDKGRLGVAFIDGGLTSTIQVDDLDANKLLIVYIIKVYFRHGKAYISTGQAKTPNQPNRCINMKIDIVKMTKTVVESVKIFNARQQTTWSIEKTLWSAQQ